jgi:hypothetical protein
MYVYTTYTRPLSVQARYSRSCPIISSSYNSSLVTWTVVCLTATKFKLLYLLCRGRLYPMLQTFAFAWFCLTSACCGFTVLYKSSAQTPKKTPIVVDVFTVMLPNTGHGRYLLCIIIRVTQQRTVYQESAFAGPCLSNRCLAVGSIHHIMNERMNA